ncbi:MAG TPA: amino acid adenylation domain-containing protein, partial [Longimicrobium sp.]|nr:amino acid adenylation domain-containing protein [Longimicrobium sp.]
LAGAPALLELPLDHPRPAIQGHHGAREPIRLPPELARRLEALGRREGATLHMVLLGAFQSLLARYAGTDDVVVGSPVAGRGRGEVEGVIGFFVNTLVLRVKLDGDPTFREVLRRAREGALGAWAHQDVPFERLVAELRPERSMSYSPLFQVLFTLLDDATEPSLPGLHVAGVEAELATAKFDLALSLTAGPGGLSGVLSYRTELFRRATIQRMLGHLTRVLEQVAADADVRLSELELMGDRERRLVVEDWNRTAADYPALPIHRIFEEHAAATPNAVAVVMDDERVSYGELNARANRLARRLARNGVGAETRVGLCLRRDPELVVALLAVLKAGGAYVPLDAGYPDERLAWMLDDAEIAVLLTEEALRGSLPARGGMAVVSVDGDRERIAGESAENLAGGAGADGLAYVMYTSGSTGTPKGVAVEHRSVARLVRGADYVELGPAEVILQAAPVSFDASTFEIWGALLNGGRLVLLPGAAPTLEELGGALIRHGVTTLWLTAGLFQAMVEERVDDLRTVRQLLTGGDVVPAHAVARVRERFPACRVINGYGPTENTTFTCCHTVAARWSGGPVPIGSAIRGTRVRVLNAALRPLPDGAPGELFAGGAGVARGYLNRPALTAERFLPDPFAVEPGARMYRTGDRVRRRADGVVDYLGRIDQQVKIRGFRIEPGEIEAVLGRERGVAACAVVPEPADAAGGRRLVAYVVGTADADALRTALRRTLPEYMVPAVFVALHSLPLTPNGKVDVRALPAPESTPRQRHVPPRTPTEELLAGILEEVLGVERVGATDGFHELGGHSLAAMRVVSRIREAFGAELPLRAVFERPTVAELAEAVDEIRRDRVPPLPRVVPVDRSAPLPLSFAQERLWFLDRLEGASPLYTIPVALRIGGALDVAALERALGEIVRRHESLRTTFGGAAGEV